MQLAPPLILVLTLLLAGCSENTDILGIVEAGTLASTTKKIGKAFDDAIPNPENAIEAASDHPMMSTSMTPLKAHPHLGAATGPSNGGWKPQRKTHVIVLMSITTEQGEDPPPGPLRKKAAQKCR